MEIQPLSQLKAKNLRNRTASNFLSALSKDSVSILITTKIALPRRSWLRLAMEDPDPPLDTPEGFWGLKTWMFEGPKSIGSLWVPKKFINVQEFRERVSGMTSKT